MTPGEQAELDALAKLVTAPRARQPHPAVLPLYVPALRILADAWRPGQSCTMCPRRCDDHTCGCPHGQVRKWARKRGMWPADRQAA